jgi:hypothetical protein
MRFPKHFSLSALLGLAGCLVAVPALAQSRGATLTLRFNPFSPLIALIAGILILIFPRLLNYIVAIYLILIGLYGLFAR